MRSKIYLLLLILTILLVGCNAKENDISNIDNNENETINNTDNLSYDDLEEKFKELSGVSLTAKEVQYDMENNLDKEFILIGKLSVCDYYNYGYTNQTNLFCGELQPFNGDDSWYVYFSREKVGYLYEELLQHDVDMMMTAKISSKVYQQGQGNMAGAVRISTNK